METNRSNAQVPAGCRRSRSWLAAALVLAGAVWMMPNGRFQEYGSVPWFLAGAGVMLGGFFVAMRFPPRSALVFWSVAVVARLVLLFQAPGDDIYRYVWEGRILLAGWNPYLYPPDAAALASMRDGVWELVQHKTFTAIYPPLAQWMMVVLSAICAEPIFFKSAFALADIAVVALLVRRFGIVRAVTYAWNPLVIYAFAGGGHYDSVFVLAMVLGWLAWLDGRTTAAAAWLGVAVALKWLALPLSAWIGWKLLVESWRTRAVRPVGFAILAGALPVLLAYLALSWWSGEWTLQLHPQKFSQYARSAEFLPRLIGWFWEQTRYQNYWFAVPMAIGWAWIILRGRDFARSAETIFFVMLVLAPMIHAWYFTWIMPFAVATRNRGAILLTASGFVYFLLSHHVAEPGGQWLLRPWEIALLWLPYAVGFLWSASRDCPEKP